MISETLVAASEPDAVVERIAAPDTSIVTLTITEGGYGGGSDMLALLARGLAARGGSEPLAVLSCDNVPRNGEATRRAVGPVGPGSTFPSTTASRRPLPIHWWSLRSRSRCG